MPPITPEARRGRLLLLIAIGVSLFGDLCIILLKIAKVGMGPSSAGSVLRWLITFALFYAVWLGHRWVRWLMVGLCGLGVLLSISLILRTWHPIAVGMLLQFSVTVTLLAFPPSVSAFLEYQRARNKEDS